MDYKEGVMAERQRCILVALQATQEDGTPCEAAHDVAHQISRAGKELAIPVESWNVNYSVFGERRLLLEHPTFLEGRESPFTHEGRKYMRQLKRTIEALKNHASPAGLDMVAERVLQARSLEEDVYRLQQDKQRLQAQVHDMEETITALTSQLKGKLG